MQETWVQSLGQEDPLEEETATPVFLGRMYMENFISSLEGGKGVKQKLKEKC